MSNDAQPAPTIAPGSSLQERGEKLSKVISFVGCGVYRFERTGRTQLESLIRNGLSPWHKFLEIGSGAFCGGYWAMHFLDAGNYHGIEPNVEMHNGGVAHVLEPELVELKQPKFDHNDQYDFSVFGSRFDYFFAQSIWTHAGKKDIEKMLDGFAEFGADKARFLTTIKLPDLFHRDYKGDDWVGASHKSNEGGTVRHSFKWIQDACAKRNLAVKRLGERINTQHLILIEKL